LLPVLAIAILITLAPGSVLAFAFPILFGAGMGIKTVVQATAAPALLRESAYGSLQGIVLMPVYVAQALAPFLAAMIWQASGSAGVLEMFLLVTAIVAEASFACAIGLARRRQA